MALPAAIHQISIPNPIGPRRHLGATNEKRILRFRENLSGVLVTKVRVVSCSVSSPQIANNIYAGGAGIINLESHRVWSYNQMLSKIFVDRPNIPACALYSHGSWSAPKNSLRSRTPGTHSRARERAQLEGTRRTLANLFQTLNPTSDDRRA